MIFYFYACDFRKYQQLQLLLCWNWSEFEIKRILELMTKGTNSSSGKDQTGKEVGETFWDSF